MKIDLDMNKEAYDKNFYNLMMLTSVKRIWKKKYIKYFPKYFNTRNLYYKYSLEGILRTLERNELVEKIDEDTYRLINNSKHYCYIPDEVVDKIYKETNERGDIWVVAPEVAVHILAELKYREKVEKTNSVGVIKKILKGAYTEQKIKAGLNDLILNDLIKIDEDDIILIKE